MVMDKETEQKLIVGVSVGAGCLVAVTILVVLLLVIRRRILDKRGEHPEPDYYPQFFGHPPSRPRRQSHKSNISQSRSNRSNLSQSAADDSVRPNGIAFHHLSFQRDQGSSGAHGGKVPYPDPYRPSLNFPEGQKSRPPVRGPGQVPFRDSRLPSSNVYFTYDGRLHKPELPINEQHAAPFDGLPYQNDRNLMGHRGWPYDMYNYQRQSAEGRKAVSEIALHQPKGDLHYHQHQINDKPPPLPPPRQPKQTSPEKRASEYHQFLNDDSRLGNKVTNRFMEWTTSFDIGEETHNRNNESTTTPARSQITGEYTTYTHRTKRYSDPYDKHFLIKRQDSNLSNPAFSMGEDNYTGDYETSIRHDNYIGDYETTIRPNSYIRGNKPSTSSNNYDGGTDMVASHSSNYKATADVFSRHDRYMENDDVFARRDSYMDGNGPSSRINSYTGGTSSAMQRNSLTSNNDVFARHNSYVGTANGTVGHDSYTESNVMVAKNNSYTGSVDVYARQNSYTGSNHTSTRPDSHTGNRNISVSGQNSYPGPSGISFIHHNHTNGRNIILGRHPTDIAMQRPNEDSPSENSEYDTRPIWPMWQSKERDARLRFNGGGTGDMEETRWNQITRRWMEDYDYEKYGKIPRVTTTISSRDDRMLPHDVYF